MLCHSLQFTWVEAEAEEGEEEEAGDEAGVDLDDRNFDLGYICFSLHILFGFLGFHFHFQKPKTFRTPYL